MKRTRETLSITSTTTGASGDAAAGGAPQTQTQTQTHEVEDADFVQIQPLGGGREVGRSCHILRFKGKTVMLDCGVHPAHTGLACLPFYDSIDLEDVDVLLVTHFHLDHFASLPYLAKQPDFRAKIFATYPTRAVGHLMLKDYLRVSAYNTAPDQMLYTEKELDCAIERIVPVNYEQVVHHKGVKFWAYTAGHVLGACMFMIEIAGVRILYTGDYSRRADRHLSPAALPKERPDILMVEATYGIQTLPDVEEREKFFTDSVAAIIRRGGRCLIPVFALGRAQELLLILDEYWGENDDLKATPIFYASALARKCMDLYRAYVEFMNEGIREKSRVQNPFDFRFVQNLARRSDFTDTEPSVVMASPGMLQSGLSRELFEKWCTNKKNGCVIPGYCVAGTLAHDLKVEPSSIETLDNATLPLNMSVHYVSFSAHSDYAETSEFIEELRPSHVVLVHGEMNVMNRLYTALKSKYEAREDKPEFYQPHNGETTMIEFRPQAEGKLRGDLAAAHLDATTSGYSESLSGIVVKRDFAYTIVEPKDLASEVGLEQTLVRQSLTVNFSQTYHTLWHVLGQVYDLEAVDEAAEKAAAKAARKKLAALRRAERAGEAETAAEAAADAVKMEGVHDVKMKAAGEKEEEEEEEEEDEEEEKRAAEEVKGPAAELLGPVISVHGSVRVRVLRKLDEGEEAKPGLASEKSGANAFASPLLAECVVLEWASDHVNDMIVDSIVELLLNINTAGVARLVGAASSCCHGRGNAHADGQSQSQGKGNRKGKSKAKKPKRRRAAADDDDEDDAGDLPIPEQAPFEVASAQKPSTDSLKRCLETSFNDVTVDDVNAALHFSLNEVPVSVDTETLAVACDDAVLKERVSRLVSYAKSSLCVL